MVRAWGCAWKRLMTCLILSRSFSCHKYTYEEKSTLHPYLQSETQMDRQRRVPGPFVPQMNLCRKCISLCASGFYQREGFSLRIVTFLIEGERQKKLDKLKKKR